MAVNNKDYDDVYSDVTQDPERPTLVTPRHWKYNRHVSVLQANMHAVGAHRTFNTIFATVFGNEQLFDLLQDVVPECATYASYTMSYTEHKCTLYVLVRMPFLTCHINSSRRLRSRLILRKKNRFCGQTW